MRDYQLKKMKEFVLPDTVYRQAIWAVKDMPRIIKEIKDLQEISVSAGSVVKEISSGGIYSDRTGKTAVRLAILSAKKDAIENAFDSIPEKYREGIKNKLFYSMPYGDEYHPNTWKKWQQIYIYNVACKLDLY